MPDETKPQSEKAGSDQTVLRLGLAAIAAVFALGVVYLLQGTGQGFKLAYGDGKASVEVSSADSLESIVQRALEQNRELATGDLAQLGFHSLESVTLADALRTMKGDDEQSAKVARAIRTVMWNLEGPFAPPLTFAGADDRVATALDDLEAALRERGEANALLAELLRRSLKREKLFRTRNFAVELTIAPGGKADTDYGWPKFFICAGSELVGSNVTLWATGPSLPDGFVELPGVLADDEPVRNDCAEPRTLEDLLAGASEKLALDRQTFAQLVGGAEIGPDELNALGVKITVHPRGTYDAAFLLTEPER